MPIHEILGWDLGTVRTSQGSASKGVPVDPRLRFLI